MERYEQYIGKTLSGKYHLTELLGIGGMAYVFKASVIGTDDVVSIKILNEEYNHDEKAVKRFVNESKAVSMFCHRNIVGIYDVGFDDNLNFIAMEYVDGITLKEYIDFKKCIDWKEAVYYISQVLKALGHAHSLGIIHRDVKPHNVMITRDGIIKVMDFGIAKMLNSESLTMTDKSIGTVEYISPEQASAKKIGFYSDIYSVGIMLYEMVTGSLPFVADSPMAVAMMQIQNIPEPPTNINQSLPRGLEQIILKAMSKDPEDRFSSCGAMDKALSMLVENPNIVFSEKHSSGKAKKRSDENKKNASIFPIIAGVTLAFFLVAAFCAINIGIKFYQTQFSDTGTDIRIPKLVGSQYSEELALQLSENRFEVFTENGSYDPDKPIGEILSQRPDGGSTRKLSNPNSTCELTLIINAEPGKVILDDYSNIEARLARIELSRLGIKCETVSKKDDAIIEGYIISTDPVGGTAVALGSTVTLYVSKGANIKTTVVPQILGLDVENAKELLQNSGISLGEITYENSEKPANTVISASLDEGQKVPEKITEISLTLSNGISTAPIVINPDVNHNPTVIPNESEQEEPPASEADNDEPSLPSDEQTVRVDAQEQE